MFYFIFFAECSDYAPGIFDGKKIGEVNNNVLPQIRAKPPKLIFLYFLVMLVENACFDI